MNDLNIKHIPAIHSEVEYKSVAIETMVFEVYIGALLRRIFISSKQARKFLEL